MQVISYRPRNFYLKWLYFRGMGFQAVRCPQFYTSLVHHKWGVAYKNFEFFRLHNLCRIVQIDCMMLWNILCKKRYKIALNKYIDKKIALNKLTESCYIKNAYVCTVIIIISEWSIDMKNYELKQFSVNYFCQSISRSTRSKSIQWTPESSGLNKRKNVYLKCI